MKMCNVCGATLEDNASVCNVCGAKQPVMNQNIAGNMSGGQAQNGYGMPNGQAQNGYGMPNGQAQNGYGMPNGQVQNGYGMPNGQAQNGYGMPGGQVQNGYGMPNGQVQNGYGMPNGQPQVNRMPGGQPQNNNKKSSKTGMIIGIVIGAIVLIAAIVVLILFLNKKKDDKSTTEATTEITTIAEETTEEETTEEETTEEETTEEETTEEVTTEDVFEGDATHIRTVEFSDAEVAAILGVSETFTSPYMTPYFSTQVALPDDSYKWYNIEETREILGDDTVLIQDIADAGASSFNNADLVYLAIGSNEIDGLIQLAVYNTAGTEDYGYTDKQLAAEIIGEGTTEDDMIEVDNAGRTWYMTYTPDDSFDEEDTSTGLDMYVTFEDGVALIVIYLDGTDTFYMDVQEL